MGAYIFLKRHGMTIAAIVGLVVSVLMYVTLVGGQPPANSDREVHYASGAYDFSLYMSYLFSILSGVILLGFFILQVSRDPKRGLPSLVLGVGVIVLYFLFSAMGDATITPEAVKMELTAARVQSIDAWLYLTYLFSFASVIALVGIVIYGAVKHR
jgi:hypothetical protein